MYYLQRRTTLTYGHYMPKELMPQSEHTTQTRYDVFFLAMKYNLVNTLKLCKPQYFSKREKIGDLRVQRFIYIYIYIIL